MTDRFQDKVVVVTGGNSGIGLATAKAFADQGAFVFISGRRQDTLDAAVAASGGKITAVRADIARLSDIDALYAAVGKAHDHIDVLFANAGGGEFAPLDAITEAQFDSVFDTNVKGTLFTVQKALPLLRDGAVIILTGSTTGSKGTPAFSAYSATKAAIRNFARSWALDLKDRRIRVNVVSPGMTETPGADTLFGGREQAEVVRADIAAAAIPSGRVGQPAEVARVVLFLASDDASYVNGAELFVDGGMAQV